MKKIQNYFMAVLGACSFFISCTAQQQDLIEATEFNKAIQQEKNAQILDVRTPAEYKSGHIANALLADWNNQEEFMRRIEYIDKAKPIYIYCLSGGRSQAASNFLQKKGFTKIVELQGGINAWKSAQMDIEGAGSQKTQLSLSAFQASISGPNTVLVDFGATWCPPCRTMEPIIQSLQKNYTGKFNLINVDGGNDTEILQYYKVTALPVFIIFKNGKEVWRRDGIATEAEIAAHL